MSVYYYSTVYVLCSCASTVRDTVLATWQLNEKINNVLKNQM